jgi:hypothetical protein
MDHRQATQLSNPEKNLIAMGAAMGGGCRTCADKLYGTAVAMNIEKRQMLNAFVLGLEAKIEAIKTMQAKVKQILGENEKQDGVVSEDLVSLIRIASFAAANSAPDVFAEIQKARQQGVSLEPIKISIQLGKMVRKNANMFSDQEIMEGLSLPETDLEEFCCPGSANKIGATGCSCG